MLVLAATAGLQLRQQHCDCNCSEITGSLKGDELKGGGSYSAHYINL